MTDNQLSKKSRIPNEVQQRVLALHREGKEPVDIMRLTELHISSVQAIIERGVVQLQSYRKPIKCLRCGAMLDIGPCLICQLVGAR